MGRTRLTTVIILTSFLLVWARLFYWQVLSYDSLKKLADNQHYFRLEIPATRGEILASDYSALVTNKTAYLVFVEKKYIDDEKELTKTLASMLEEEEASIAARLSSHEVWVPIKHQVEEEKVEKLKKLNIAGLGFERDDKRYYPESSMAAHLLGFVGKDETGQPTGYFGLEGRYDKELTGISGYLLQERDALGNPIVIGENERIEPKKGRTLVLYLDKTIQFVAEEKLKKAIKFHGAASGNVIVIDPKTGGVLASASYPSYDPSAYDEFPSNYYKNPVIADTYEPGSTFKPIVMAKAIEEGKVKKDDTVDESGPVPVLGYVIRTWNDEYHGEITMSEILQYSSNVGMVYVSQKLGKKNMLDILSNIGLGSKTNIDLQEETATTIRKDSEWREIDLATASFGQGIAVTPIQMVFAIQALANEGVQMEPHVVKQVISENGEVYDIKPKQVKTLFSRKTARTVTEMMVSAVENGVGKWNVPKGFRIAGKSGTAQIPVEGHYDEEKTIASFVGFAPADDPKFVILVTLREPTSSPWGAGTAGPLFFDIVNELLPYYGLTPN